MGRHSLFFPRMNPDHEFDQVTASQASDLLPENETPSPSAVLAAPAGAAVSATRRGRPPGNRAGTKPAKSGRGSAAKTSKPTRTSLSATTAAFAMLADLTGDDLAVAVHTASPAARAVIVQLLKAGI